MPKIKISAALALTLDPDTLAMQVHLTPHEAARLIAGDALDVGDRPAARLAQVLGVPDAALLVSGAATANDGDHAPANDRRDVGVDADPIYDDGPVVMEAERVVERPAEPEPIDAEAVLARVVAESGGVYTVADGDLVAMVLAAAQLPPTLTARELPAFLRAWLAPAAELRQQGRATPAELLVRVEEEGSKRNARIARALIGLSERAVAKMIAAGLKSQGGPRGQKKPPL